MIDYARTLNEGAGPAILTRFCPARGSSPARITASAGRGRWVSCPSVYSYHNQFEHFRAAEALCHRMGWQGELRAGALRGGFVFVWAGQSDPVEFRNAYTVRGG